MQFPPEVERWRATVAKYFPPQLVDKALWTIQHESGGNPGAVGDGGRARGLFQIQDQTAFSNRPDAAWLDNPENNIKYAAQNLGAATGNFAAWGENNTYDGKPFGAFGNNAYPGSLNMSIPADDYSSGPSAPSSDSDVTIHRLPGGRIVVVDNYDGRVVDSYFEDGGNNVGSKPFYWDSLTPEQQQAYIDGEVQGVSPYQQGQDDKDRAYKEAQDKIDQANKDRDYALSVGDQALAKQRQADANYWSGVQAQIDQDRNGLTARGQDIDYATAMAGIAQQKYDSDQRYMIGMANATNDADRNRIEALWNREQAAIAVMEDETKRILGGQANQTAQFSAETDRAARMGNLALDNNKFIQQMATSPRDSFGLYMMQRGLAPDWDTMANGGTPGQGASLVPADVMNAYKPVTAPPTFTAGTPANPAAANVGKASGSYAPAANPFIQPLGSVPAPAAPAAAPAPWKPTPLPQGGPPQVKAEAPYAGVRNTDVAGLSEWTGQTGLLGPSKVSDYTSNGWKVYGQGGGEITDPNMDISPGATITVRRFAGGGYTTAPMFMAGDSPARNPAAGGARPELIENPTQAPIRVHPNPKTMQAYGPLTGQRPARVQQVQAAYGPQTGGYLPTAQQPAAQPQTGGYLPTAQPQQQMPMPADHQMGPAAFSGPMSMPGKRPSMPNYAAYGQMEYGMQQQPMRSYDPRYAMMQRDDEETARLYANAMPSRYDNTDVAVPRYALGTDNSAAYAANGMGSAWINSSNNSHLAGMELPTRLNSLAAYGMPIAPSLAAGSTGRTIGQANVSAAYGARGGGTLASMQGLNRMTPGEQELYRGYAEGVVGVPWADLVDYLSKGTQSLRTAARAS